MDVKHYEQPELELILLEQGDIITESKPGIEEQECGEDLDGTFACGEACIEIGCVD